MRVLFADSLPETARNRLIEAGFEVTNQPALSGDALAGELSKRNPSVLVVRSTRVTAEQLDAAPGLSLVVRAGAGVNTIDLDACSDRGIYVANCPGKNAVAVAELTFGLILALDRHIAACVSDLQQAQWNKKRYGKSRGLKGRTLGILGMGQIGVEVAERAQAFGLEVLVWSRSMTEERAQALGVESCETPEALARRSDILTVHLAETPETRGLVGTAILEALPHGAMLINTSRAGVVDEAALLVALEERGLRAGLDVFSDEPSSSTGVFEHVIAQHPNVIGTHHIGASTEQAQYAVAEEACRIVETFRRTGRVPNCVNLTEDTEADTVLIVRHRDEVGVLAGVLDKLRIAGINVAEMENTIFATGKAASARIQLEGRPPEAVIDAIASQEHVLHTDLVSVER